MRAGDLPRHGCYTRRRLRRTTASPLAELQRLWLIEAVKYQVVPLDDRRYEQIHPTWKRLRRSECLGGPVGRCQHVYGLRSS